MSAFDIRPTTPADVDSVVLLREEVAAEDRWIGEASSDERDQVVTRTRAGLEDPNAASFVADVNGVIVGSIAIASASGLASLGMFVQFDHRGRGMGAALLDAAVDWARRQGCHKVILEVWPHNVAARSLYLSRDFVEEGHRPRQHRRRDGSLWDSIDMGLVLDSSSPGCPHQPHDAAR